MKYKCRSTIYLPDEKTNAGWQKLIAGLKPGAFILYDPAIPGLKAGAIQKTTTHLYCRQGNRIAIKKLYCSD